MTTPNRGVGKFTTQNLVAVFRAVPESNGTYADVARIAKDYDGNVQPHTIARWIQASNADIRNDDNTTAYARFTRQYQEMVNGHSRSEAHRSRELAQALEILERTCECGNQKMLLENGKVAEQC